MKFLKQIQSLESEIYKNMFKCSQITIDWVQNTEVDLNIAEYEDPITRDQLGAINYKLNILIEVFDHSKDYDISVLKRLDKIIEDWRNDIEFVNRALGIPLHKG